MKKKNGKNENGWKSFGIMSIKDKTKLNFLFMLISMVILACNNKRYNIEGLITAKAGSIASGDSVISLSQIIPFDWDTLFVFHENINSERIAETLQHEYANSRVPDGMARWIFKFKGSVVYEEDFSADASNLTEVEINMPADPASLNDSSRTYTRLLKFITKEQSEFYIKVLSPRAGCRNCILYRLFYVPDRRKNIIIEP